MPGLTDNLYLLTPEFALAGLAFLVFIVDLLLPEDRKDLLGLLSVVGLLGMIVLSLLMLPGKEAVLYGGLLAVDAYSLFFKVFFLAIGVFIILSSIDYVKLYLNHPGEFYGLLLFSILGNEPDGYVAGVIDGLHFAGVAQFQLVRDGGLRPGQSQVQRGQP